MDLNETPTLKICDFGFSKGGFDSQPKTQIGTPCGVYSSRGVRRGATVRWTSQRCVGVRGIVIRDFGQEVPFSRSEDPGSSHKMMQRVLSGTAEIRVL